MSKRILLIEDNPDHTLLTKRILQGANEGYQLDCASDVKEGLNKIFTQDYDVILCDYRLSDLNALDLLREMNKRQKILPFIVITSSGNEKIAVEAMKQGAYDYVVKDFSYKDTLPMVIQKSIERYNLWEAKERAEKELEDAYQKLKETQEQLIQSGKMAAMGQLAAGISHELNQPLTGIKGFVQAMLMDIEKDSPMKEDLEKIEQQADRMDKIIKNIRFFAKKADFKLRPLDINQPIDDSFMLLNEQLRLHNIKVEKYLNPDLPRVKGDSNQLQQVFLNFITNARDAIDALNKGSGGKIAVTTDLDKGRQSIKVIFSDTGCGIKKEDLSNIFNPFYTTKSPGGGIGLGLSICYRIIQEHKAAIEVESRLGEGTTFTLTFPMMKNGK
ncbi:MAG: ATP-binding protein [Candidatus Omnitrophota bacterium]